MTLYEFNQAGYSKMPNYTEEDIHKAILRVSKFLSSHDSKYYMFLNHDERYFTLFIYKEEYHRYRKMAEEILTLAQELGPIKEISVEDDRIEFWVGEGDDCKMYLFFDYFQGVIEI
jgi:hypothetical protein